MRILFALFVLAMSSAVFAQVPVIESGVSQELAVWRAAHYSDVRYKPNLTLEKMSPVLKGTIEIRVNVCRIPSSLQTPSSETIQGKRPVLSAPTGYPMPPIILDWRKIAGHEKDSTISNVTINGNSVMLTPPSRGVNEELRAEDVHAKFIEANEHLIFDEFVQSGENVIKLDFTSPILTSGSAI